jgi:hypothetical protein
MLAPHGWDSLAGRVGTPASPVLLLEGEPGSSVSVCGEGCTQMFEVDMETRISELKQAVASRLGSELGPIKELVFMKERCEDARTLADYGLNQHFIRQVAGFAIDPPEPGMKFIDGKLVPWDTPEPDYDRYDV